MNNLHRELAPISDAAWAQIDEEASRTLKRYLAGRRVVDLQGPSGVSLAAVGTGHLQTIAAPGDGVLAQQREAKALVELRVPFDLDRQMIDDVERGAKDSDWQPAKDAAKKIAFAEDVAIFEGYAAGGIQGVRQGTSNPIESLPADVRNYPDAIAHALSQLRLVGVRVCQLHHVVVLATDDRQTVVVAFTCQPLDVGDMPGSEVWGEFDHHTSTRELDVQRSVCSQCDHDREVPRVGRGG